MTGSALVMNSPSISKQHPEDAVGAGMLRTQVQGIGLFFHSE